jgi:hypothetical protein
MNQHFSAGMVKEIAKIFYDKTVGVKVRSQTMEAFSDRVNREHVVFDVHCLSQQEIEEQDIPTMVAQTKKHAEKQILKQVSASVTLYTEGSKSNIPCCAQYLRLIRGCDARAHPAHMSRECYAQNSRTMSKCCAHLPRREERTRDVTFGPLSWQDLPLSMQEEV